MTIPLSPASERRGPRETLLALTAVYLRHGELDPDARHSVASLAARASGSATHALDASVPDGPAPQSAASSAIPEWGPLARALAGMLRGEVEHTLRVVDDSLRTEQVPEAFRAALLGLGIRAALAADRPVLAARWRAGLRLKTQVGARWMEARKEPLAGHEDGARPGRSAAPPADVRDAASEGAENDPAYRPGHAVADEVVLASLPMDVRELLARSVDEGGWMAGFPSAEAPPSPEPGPAARPQDGTAAATATGGSANDDRDDRDEPDLRGGRGDRVGRIGRHDRGGAGRPVVDEADADARARELRGAATLHVVMDAYHGDVVSVPARVEVLAWRPIELLDDPGSWQAGPELGAGPEAAGEGPVAAWAAEAGWGAEGLPLLTVRVAAGEELPQAPDAEGWHLRFVGRLRALDARTSDGSLLELSWEDGGFVATLHPPDWLEELPDAPPVVATRVTHVVLVPESDTEGSERGAGPGD